MKKLARPGRLLPLLLVASALGACNNAGDSSSDGAVTTGEGGVAVGDGASTDSAAAADASPDLPPCPVAMDATSKAKLKLTADDYLTISFNGVEVAAPTSLWTTLKQYDVDVFLHPRRLNVIAVEARNEWKQDGFDRGVIIELAYTTGATMRYVNSDATWKVSPARADNWIALSFDDSQWAQAVSLGKSGIAPWGSVAFNTNAEWIWSYRPDKTAAQKVDKETIYLRKIFYMDTEGVAAGQPGNCR